MMNIELACEHFKALLMEQEQRLATLRKEKKDYATIQRVTVGLVDGDGIGPIIMEQALRVLEKLLADEIASGQIILKRIKGLTIENRMALGVSVPEDVLAQIVNEFVVSGTIPNCPHGRPIAIALTKKQLEKSFGRRL